MSACLWCENDVPYWKGSGFDSNGACVRCGARHEFDGELADSGNWRGSSVLLSTGKPELRADTDETDAAVAAMEGRP